MWRGGRLRLPLGRRGGAGRLKPLSSASCEDIETFGIAEPEGALLEEQGLGGLLNGSCADMMFSAGVLGVARLGSSLSEARDLWSGVRRHELKCILSRYECFRVFSSSR